MKLSKQTIAILNNYSDINQSILVKKGNQLRTISVMKNILAECQVDEDFPQDFAIYDLPQFLKIIRIYDNPELEFSQNFLTIKEGKNKTGYFFADPNVVVSPPDKQLSLPSIDVSFQVNYQELSKLISVANTLDVPDLSVIGQDGKVSICVRDKKNDTSNHHSISVGETDKEFTCHFKVENIKIVPGTYNVTISSQCLSKFVCENYDLTYFIALEPDSTFES